MDIIYDNEGYNDFKNILVGCITLLDAFKFTDYYIKKYPEMKELIKSKIEGKKYSAVLNIETMLNIMTNINNVQFKEQGLKIMETENYQLNEIQRATIMRIIAMKPNKLSCHKLITKNCPHCGRKTVRYSNTTYVVCGYDNSKDGYNGIGCMNDWCFRCGKKLCKSWSTNKLYVSSNRYHNNECCYHHAKLHGNIYPDDYCQCEYIIDRTKLIELYDDN